MKIYRIEKDGRGPFSAGQGWQLGLSHCYGNPRFPCARVDYMDAPEVMLYGVQSKRLLRSWFPKRAREVLQERGFYLIAYTVPKAHVEIGFSKRQVRFNKQRVLSQAKLSWDSV